MKVLSRRLWAALLLLAVSAAFLGVFIVMWIEGNIRIAEPCLWIRISEVVLFVLITVFAVYHFIKETGVQR